MGKLNKFEDVDVFASLEAIMKQNTGFYQSDFDIDRQIIAEKAASPNKEDKTLLWLSRPSGTYCFRERDVFIKDTAPNNTWRFYKEQTRDLILAYAVELTGEEFDMEITHWPLEMIIGFARANGFALPGNMPTDEQAAKEYLIDYMFHDEPTQPPEAGDAE